MSDEIAIGQEAETELVFKARPVWKWAFAASMLAGWSFCLFAMVLDWPRPLGIVSFALWSFALPMLLNVYCFYTVRVSKGGIVAGIIGNRVSVKAEDLRRATMTANRVVKIEYEKDGRVVPLMVAWPQLGRQNRYRLLDAIREMWPEVVED